MTRFVSKLIWNLYSKIKAFAATCAMFGSKCQNGATCVDHPTGRNGFMCQCPAGFYGGLCEYRKYLTQLYLIIIHIYWNSVFVKCDKFNLWFIYIIVGCLGVNTKHIKQYETYIEKEKSNN